MADPGLFDSETVRNAIGGAGGLTLVAGALYKAVQMFRADRRDDRRESHSDAVNATIWERVKQLETRCDTFANERNEVAAKAAELAGQVTVLQGHVDRLNEDVATLQSEREELRTERAELLAKIEALQAERNELLARRGHAKPEARSKSDDE
jgi:uncharacterized coiled-coil DUF342 family protein